MSNENNGIKPVESHASHTSHNSYDTHNSPKSSQPLLSPRGDYRNLLSFQKAELVYDITFRFAHKYFSKGLIDQQIRRLEKDFLEQGGLRERMTRARLAYRKVIN